KRMGPAIREALEQWEQRRRHSVRRKAQGLAEDPGRVAAELHQSAFGIDWMLRHWRGLRAALAPGRCWAGADLARALHLLGLPARRPEDVGSEARRLWDAAVAACPPTVDLQAAPVIADERAAK